MNESSSVGFGCVFMTASFRQCSLLPGVDSLDQFEHVYLKKSRTALGPDVVQLTAPDGVKFVMKDWSRRPWWSRQTWCRVAAHREIKVYERLRGMYGVPQLICTLGHHGFIMEWLDARPLPRRKMRDFLGLEFFVRLDELVEEMHRRGVAHGDLRRRNILRGVDGLPRLIDFETAVRKGAGEEGGRLFQAVCRIDKITVLKIRSIYFPESISAEDRALLDDVPWHLSAGRYVRQNVYGRFTKKGRRRRRKEQVKGQ